MTSSGFLILRYGSLTLPSSLLLVRVTDVYLTLYVNIPSGVRRIETTTMNIWTFKRSPFISCYLYLVIACTKQQRVCQIIAKWHSKSVLKRVVRMGCALVPLSQEKNPVKAPWWVWLNWLSICWLAKGLWFAYSFVFVSSNDLSCFYLPCLLQKI